MQFRLERVRLPHGFVLLELPLLLSAALQLSVVLLLEGLDAEPIFEDDVLLLLLFKDLLFVQDPERLHLVSLVLLCLLLDVTQLELFSLKFQFGPKVDRQTIPWCGVGVRGAN